MVYLDIYDSIFEYLKKMGIVDDVFLNAEAVLSHLLKNVKNNEMYNDLVAEFSLFNYEHNNQLLIDFLYENLYPNLDKNNKKEFNLIKESKRFNLKFEKKEIFNKLDTKQKQLYDFYFQDLDNNKTKIILSSTALDELKHNLNTRLIKHPEYENRHLIIGGIYDKKTFEAVSSLSSLKSIGNRFKEIEDYKDYILEFSKIHTLEEIDKYDDKRSAFLEQDKKIMKINRIFFEKFNKGFDDFLKDFLNLSNDKTRFIEMVDYYLSIADDLRETILDTDYHFSLKLLVETSLIKGFSAFIKNNKQEFNQCLIKIKNEAKKEFENSIKANTFFSREEIMKNNKRFLNEKIAPLKLNNFNQFIKKLNTYSAKDIELFFTDIINYLEPSMNKIVTEDIGFFITSLKLLFKNSENISYKNEVLNDQKNIKYNPDIFYEYIGVDDGVYDLFVFMSIVDYILNKDIKGAYELVKEKNIEKTKSFDMMFLLGKILSFYDDKNYKPYFNHVKKIDKQRYKDELKAFLDQKEENNLWGDSK